MRELKFGLEGGMERVKALFQVFRAQGSYLGDDVENLRALRARDFERRRILGVDVKLPCREVASLSANPCVKGF